MMYLEHFGLREAPFRITPHTGFFFAGGNRGATLEALIYAIAHDEGIVKVAGEVGSGKTMLCRMLLEKLPAQIETVYLANPSLSREEILYAIADELHVPVSGSRATPAPHPAAHLVLRALQERLIARYAAGRQVVILIDEAHAMPAETLEEIRLLSNLESNRHKLLQIVLFGQPELDERLAETGMRQLNERITHHFVLEPLRRTDIPAYLMFRMRAAGYRGPDPFTPGALQLIGRASEGLTRRLNILADKALLSAFSENTHRIDRPQIKAAIRDVRFTRMRDGRARPRIWIGGAIAVAAVAGAAYFAGAHRGDPAAPADRPLPTLAKSNPEAAPTLARRIAVSEEWLKSAPDNRLVIQVSSADSANAREAEKSVEDFIASHAASLDPQQIRVSRSVSGGRTRLTVIYGAFSSRETANAALAGLPESVRASKPYVRTVGKLRQ
ncbi:MAG: AAA family ATPase [Betaproteobacteria bacterium]|nr:AAA family ATPase [Betaproteobacteria bacterium]